MVVQRQGDRGRAVALAVAAGLVAGAAAVAGCAGVGAVAAEDIPADGGLSLVREAADALVRSGSSKARTTMETANGGTRVTIRGSGGFDYGEGVGRLRVVLPDDAAGSQRRRPVTELLAPGELYMKDRGAGVPADKWVRVDTTGLADGNLVTGGATDPLSAAELLRGAREVVYVGEAKAAGDGAVVRHYRGVCDIRRAAELASAHARGALAAAAEGFSTSAVPFDVYLDERGRPRQVRHRFTFSAAGGERGGRDAVEVVSTTVLYGFGAPVEVDLPPEGDIYAGTVAVTGSGPDAAS